MCGCAVVAERMFVIVGISLLCLLVQEVVVWCNAWPRWSQIENLSISWDNVNVGIHDSIIPYFAFTGLDVHEGLTSCVLLVGIISLGYNLGWFVILVMCLCD